MPEPRTPDAFKLLMRGEEALTRVSNNGMYIDVPYLKNQRETIVKECENLKTKFLEETKLGQLWLSKYGHNADIDSSAQIRNVLVASGFDKFKKTEKGNDSVDKSVIEKLPYEESSLLLKRNQLKILWQSIIAKSINEVDENGFIHPEFMLHTVRTYRSSCVNPNLQQMPKNNDFQKHIVRTGFLPRSKDRCLVELDLRANEVSCGCSIHHDPNMLRFLSDPDADMHSTVEQHYYMLKDNELCKALRKSVKGRFVFAGFYGAGFESMARNLWDFVTEDNPKTGAGIPILDHLKARGINNFDDMLTHTQKEYDWFWFDLFKYYGNWKEQQWELYKKQGYLDYPTGFRVTVKMTKTQAINTVVQGSAFHVLLNTLIHLQRKFDQYKLKSLIIGQIHDSAVMDIVPNEYQTICDLYIESQAEVRKEWSWIVYPIAVEADLGEPGASWADLKEMGEIKHS